MSKPWPLQSIAHTALLAHFCCQEARPCPPDLLRLFVQEIRKNSGPPLRYRWDSARATHWIWGTGFRYTTRKSKRGHYSEPTVMVRGGFETILWQEEAFSMEGLYQLCLHLYPQPLPSETGLMPGTQSFNKQVRSGGTVCPWSSDHARNKGQKWWQQERWRDRHIHPRAGLALQLFDSFHEARLQYTRLSP